MTVTLSAIGAGVLPGKACPKLMVDRSSAMESTAWTSTSTAAAAVTVSSGGDEEHGTAAAVEFRGAGALVAKSAAFAFESVQPPAARRSAVVLVSAGAADPS